MRSKFKLGDLCEFHRGASVPRARMSADGDLIYIHYGDLYKGFSIKIDVENPQKSLPFVSKQEPIKQHQWLEDQDIVYVLTSETVEDLGHSFLFNNPEQRPAVAGTETTIVRVVRRDLLLPAYLNYVMHSPRFCALLRQYVKGMKVFRVHPDDVARIEIEAPSLMDQQAVVDTLDALYEKEMLNNRLNDYLATLVDLEFSKRFSGSVSTTSLKNVLEISTKSLKPQQHAGETWEHYSIPAFDEMHWPIFELADGIKSNKYIVDRSSILISKLNPSIKRMWIPACLTDKAVCSTEFIVYKPLEPRHKSFYCAAINADSFTAFLLEHVTGSTGSRQRAQPKATLDYPMPSPCRTAIEAFCDFADPIYRQIELNEIESQRLGSLRDALLPKLMSGEIDVSKVGLTPSNNHLCAG